MRKLVLAIVAVMLLTGIVSADSETYNRFDSFTITNNAATGKVTAISTSIIYPGVDRVLGYEVFPIVTASHITNENYITVYDSSSIVLAGEVIGESESASAIGFTRTFMYPREIENGVAVTQGAYTVAIIYFVRR